MDAQSIIAALDAELELLHQARAVLAQSDTVVSKVKKEADGKPRKAAKRVLSPEARMRIADAQRKRWAAVKKPKKAARVAAPAKAAKKVAKKTARPVAKKAVAKKAAPVKARKTAAKRAVPAKVEPPKSEAVPF
jgi:hypothetical protein